MRVLFDSADNCSDTIYSPRTLPGMDEVAKPIQGLLWASSAWTTGASRSREPVAMVDTETPLFERQ